MKNWPLGEIEYQEILAFFSHAYSVLLKAPLLDYLRRTGLGWHDVAPEPEFNYDSVSCYATGARPLSRDQFARIKQVSGISDADAPIPADRDVQLAAAAATMTMIRDRWFAGPGETGQAITPHQAQGLEIAVHMFTRNRQAQRDVDWRGILETIRTSVPRAEVWTAEDLDRLWIDWLLPHCAFYDALIEGNRFDAYRQATDL